MADAFFGYQRTYVPGQPFRLSRTKIEMFLQCPRCFYMDRRFGLGQPPQFPFTLNAAVDALLKAEFDIHRAAGSCHPLQTAYGLSAIPFKHEKMNEWRENFKGVSYFHERTKFHVFGAVDDIWQDTNGDLIVVDYKATSTSGEITLDAEYRSAYKRQMEVYQWLLRKNGFPVSNRGYFVYANGQKDRKAFDGRLEFDIQLIPYDGNDAWVEKALLDAYATLNSDLLPESSPECPYCQYRRRACDIEHGKKDAMLF